MPTKVSNKKPNKNLIVYASVSARQPGPLRLQITYEDGLRAESELSVVAAEELVDSIQRAFGEKL